jgi:7-carboxy-7-deazaguanine synthase
VKFVLCDRADYEWARGFVLDHGLVVRCRCVLFSAAQGLIEPKRLAQWILEDGLPVRLQVQLHKVIGVA